MHVNILFLKGNNRNNIFILLLSKLREFYTLCRDLCDKLFQISIYRNRKIQLYCDVAFIVSCILTFAWKLLLLFFFSPNNAYNGNRVKRSIHLSIVSEFHEVGRIVDGRVSVKFETCREAAESFWHALADRVKVGRGGIRRVSSSNSFFGTFAKEESSRDLHRIESRGFDPEILSTHRNLVNEIIVARLTSPAINIHREITETSCANEMEIVEMVWNLNRLKIARE